MRPRLKFDNISIKKSGEDCLRAKSKPIKKISKDVMRLAKEMGSILMKSPGIGLAAPQVGFNLRMILVRTEEKDAVIFINPEILSRSTEMEIAEEGCLSVPGLMVKVERPKSIKFKATLVDGSTREFECEDLMAKVICHEVDHLDGKMITDYI